MLTIALAAAAVWLILVGITWLGWAVISAPVLGGIALLVGALVVVNFLAHRL